jgi:response regulator RpfG family c-di-GMP phosphodiesterase
MKSRILFVDDDPHLLAGCQRALRQSFTVDIAVGSAQGLELVARQGPYAVVVADMQMPEMNGIQFLQQMEARTPDTVRLMLTGNADQKTARQAVNDGHIFRFLNKPCPVDELIRGLTAALEQHRLITAERELLERTLSGSVKLLTDILSLLDPISFGRGQRLRDYVRLYAASFKLSQTWDLEMAALLSHIGWVTIPAPVMEKFRSRRTLSAPEQEMLSRIPQLGAQLLAHIPRLEPVAAMVLYQGKHFDGSGFPAGPTADGKIPTGARILHVLDDLLTLESAGMTKPQAFERLRRQPGKHDPVILETIIAGPEDRAFPGFAQPAKPRGIPFENLMAGAVLAQDLLTTDGTLIVTAGAAVSPTLLQKLRNFSQLSGIREPVWIQD